MEFLSEIKANKYFYSFGKIIEKVDKEIFLVSFDKTTLKLHSYKELKVNDWIKFYGELIDDIITPKVVINITGCDINILINTIKYIRENI